MTSQLPEQRAEPEKFPGGNCFAVGGALSLGESLASPGNSEAQVACEPIRRAWWMKHLSLLTVLQAASLAVGLTVFTAEVSTESAARLVPFLTFSWISLIQGGLSYLIFSRLYRTYLSQQGLIAEQLQSQQIALGRTRDDDTEGHADSGREGADAAAHTDQQFVSSGN